MGEQWRRTESIENKATSIIQVAGTITALIFGFVTFSQSTATFNPAGYIEWLIVIGVILSIASIVFSVIALQVRKYSFPIDITSYFSNPRIKLPKNPKIETISFIDAKVLAPLEL